MVTDTVNMDKTEVFERVIGENGEVTLQARHQGTGSLNGQGDNGVSLPKTPGTNGASVGDGLLPLPHPVSQDARGVQGAAPGAAATVNVNQSTNQGSEKATIPSRTTPPASGVKLTGNLPASEATSGEETAALTQEHRADQLSTKKSTPGTLMSTGDLPVQIRLDAEMVEVTHLYAAMERYTEGLLPQATTDALQAMINGATPTGGGPQVLGISSAVRREGKTTVAVQLAMNIARNTYNKVALLDLSFESGSIASNLDLKGKGGIVPVLEGRDFRIPTLQVEGCENLWVLPLGELPRNPVKTAHSPQLNEVMGAIREMFDLIIVDLPPITSGYSLPLINHTDGLLMVIASGMTPRHVVQSAFDMVGKHRVIGTI